MVKAAHDDKDLESGLLSELQELQEQQKRREEEEKAARIELLRGQAMRRMANRDIALGFSAWLEMWNAKVWAMEKLREVANRLKAPELSMAFGDWHYDYAEAKRERIEREASLRELELLHNKGQIENELWPEQYFEGGPR